MPKKFQTFCYLTRRQREFLEFVRVERDLKSQSTTIAQIADDHKQLYAPALKEFLEREATKRGYKTNDPMTTAVDIVRDVMRGVIG